MKKEQSASETLILSPSEQRSAGRALYYEAKMKKEQSASETLILSPAEHRSDGRALYYETILVAGF